MSFTLNSLTNIHQKRSLRFPWLVSRGFFRRPNLQGGNCHSFRAISNWLKTARPRVHIYHACVLMNIYGMKNALWWNIHMIYAFRFIPFTSIQCHSIHTWSYVSKSHYHRIITAIQLCNTCPVLYSEIPTLPLDHSVTVLHSFESTHFQQRQRHSCWNPKGNESTSWTLNCMWCIPQIHLHSASSAMLTVSGLRLTHVQDMSCLDKIRASPYLPAPMPATMTWQKNIGLRNMSCEHAFLWHRLQNARECK